MKLSQKARILKLLGDGKWHSVVQLHGIAWRYGARLHEARREGVKMEKRRTVKCGAVIEFWRKL